MCIRDRCNQGAFITGTGSIVYEGGIYPHCDQMQDNLTIGGGANVRLENDAVLEIPDNGTFYFTGANTSLIMSPDSKIQFGKNSKIVFENGSRLIVNGDENKFNSTQTFTVNSNELMNGYDILSNLKTANDIRKSEVNKVKEFNLSQNSPNPFNPTTKINYRITGDNYVTLKIFDLAGKEIKTLVNNFQKAGEYEVTFDGSSLSSGIYYYKIVSGNFTSIRKMMLIK